MTVARDFTVARELARELHRAVPHLVAWETSNYLAIGTGREHFVWAFVQPVRGEVRIRFEVPDDDTAGRIAERLTCRTEAGPIPAAATAVWPYS